MRLALYTGIILAGGYTCLTPAFAADPTGDWRVADCGAGVGIWPIAKAQEIPEKFLKRFMLRGTGAQQHNMKAGQEIAALIRFERLNLNDESYPTVGQFDAIFCRNVLIYFDAQSRAKVIDRPLDRLAPFGYLFVGHAESLSSVTERARHIIPTVYTRTTDDAQHLMRREAAQ